MIPEPFISSMATGCLQQPQNDKTLLPEIWDMWDCERACVCLCVLFDRIENSADVFMCVILIFHVYVSWKLKSVGVCVSGIGFCIKDL